MTVERHEFRNTNTISTVSTPPMIMVVFTSWMESRMNVRVVAHDLQRDAGRQLPAQLRHRRPDAVRHRHRVRARLLLHVEGQGGPLVEQGHVPRLLDPVHHLGQVAHEDGGARPRA